jgi:hypothetical protein
MTRVGPGGGEKSSPSGLGPVPRRSLEGDVRVSYNHFGIGSESIGSKWMILTEASPFHEFHALRWGLAIFFHDRS